MIDLYTWKTPNGYKPLIMLAELDLPFRLVPVHIGRGEQKRDEYVAKNPNGKIPTLIDEPGTPSETVVFESGAILIYLAEKAGQLLARSGQERANALAWLMFQMSAVGPMAGQLFHFTKANEKVPYALERFRGEVDRICGVLDRRLAESRHLAGDAYGIADIATITWVRVLPDLGIALPEHLERWRREVLERPAVQRALATTFD